MVKAVFVRHGQSTGNVGVPCDDLASIALTAFGQHQARDLAASWTHRPTLIVTSPYLRTQQTAEPTIDRFAGIPVEIWPIQEFTYLDPARWNGSRSSERMPYIERYWDAADPTYCDGNGAESFTALMRRAEATLARLCSLPDDALVYLFSHGQFIQAVCAKVNEPSLDYRSVMAGFWRRGEPPKISNAQCVTFTLSVHA